MRARWHDSKQAVPAGARRADTLAEALRLTDEIAPVDPFSPDLPVHPLPEEPRQRTGPFGVSTALHLGALALLLYTGLMEKEAPPPGQPPLTIAFEEPTANPAPRANAIPAAPAAPLPERSVPRPAAPKPAEARPIAPPPAPKEPPPSVPLPPPTRMGDLVPIPHYPVPGKVPPEETKSGKPGPPAPQTEPENKPSGEESGTNETDQGAGQRTGPGAGNDVARGGDTGLAEIRGEPFGGLSVPRPGGSPSNKKGMEGGGRRRGLNLELPPDSGAFGDFSFEDKDYDWNDYYSQMYWAIWRAWHNRLYVMLPIFDRWSYLKRSSVLKGSVLVRFVIERSGTISSIEVLEPSVMSPLDESAQTALKEVILPRLPDDFKKDREAVTGRFTMDVDSVEGFKQGMKTFKYRGVF